MSYTFRTKIVNCFIMVSFQFIESSLHNTLSTLLCTVCPILYAYGIPLGSLNLEWRSLLLNIEQISKLLE